MPELLLGQDLYRAALEAGSLEPFDQPIARMKDASLTPVERADAYKAARFGLAGIAIHGWQDVITEPLPEPTLLGNHQISHRFTTRHFPPHENVVFGEPLTRQPGATVRTTQGEHALGKLKHGLQESMRSFISDEHYEVNGITVRKLRGTLRKTVQLGWQHKLDTVPDSVMWGAPNLEDIYNIQLPHVVGIDAAFALTAWNAVRFSQESILLGMRHFADLYPETPRSVPQPEQYDDLDHYDPADVASVLVDAVRHPVRASQIQTGTVNVLAADSLTNSSSHIGKDRHGAPVVNWKHKHYPPGKRADVDYEMNANNTGFEPDPESYRKEVIGKKIALILRRQKCPIGYTKHAGDTMPGHKIGDSILSYLMVAGLEDPKRFMSPRVIMGSAS